MVIHLTHLNDIFGSDNWNQMSFLLLSQTLILTPYVFAPIFVSPEFEKLGSHCTLRRGEIVDLVEPL